MNRAITPQALRRNLDSVVLLDIRRNTAYLDSDEVIPGSQWLDPERIDSWIDGLPRDRDIVVYCVHGHAVSTDAVQRLCDAGLHARYLDGGIEGWKAAGGPVKPR